MRQKETETHVANQRQGNTPEKELNETGINNLSDKDFKETAIKMFSRLERKGNELSENYNKAIEKYKEPTIAEECNNRSEKYTKEN